MYDSSLLTGIPIVINNNLLLDTRVRVRRNKNNRIDKKWEKKYGWKYPQDPNTILMIDGKAYMSQKAFDKLKRFIDEEM